MKNDKLFEAISDINESYVIEAHATSKKSRSVWRKYAAMAACLCLVVAAAIALPSLRAAFLGGDVYAYTMAFAGRPNDLTIYDDALNKELLQSDQRTHLPIFMMDTLEDLEQFKSRYGTVFDLDQGFDNVLSFEGALAKAQFDTEGFFEEYTLLVVFVPASSSTFRFGIKDVASTDTSICIGVEQKNDPEATTCDGAGWFVLMQVEDEEIRNYTSFDAVFDDE